MNWKLKDFVTSFIISRKSSQKESSLDDQDEFDITQDSDNIDDQDELDTTQDSDNIDD